MTVKLRPTGWELNGEYLPWIWGQINYWDIDRWHWRDVLKAYRHAGHSVVATAVLPRIHDAGNGDFDFGKHRPELDVAAFLTEAKEVGLKTVLWIGPRDVPGVAAAGYPDALLRDEQGLARDAQGRIIPAQCGCNGDSFPLPSLVAEQLSSYLRPFAIGLKKALAGSIHPDGSVIGIGLTQAPGWGTALSAFAADYSQAGIDFYHAFLKKQYSRVLHLNQAYGTQFTSFQAIHPPQSGVTSENLPEPRLLDWAKCREDYFVKAAETMHAIFGELAFERIPIFLSSLPVFSRPANLAELEKERCFAYIAPDMPLVEPGEFGVRLNAQTRFLVNFRFQLPPASGRNSESDLQMIAHGVRGWEAMAPAGAGALSGFLTDRFGTLRRPRPAWWDTLLQANASEGLLNSQMYADIALMTSAEMERARYLYAEPTTRLDVFGQQPEYRLAAAETLPEELQRYFRVVEQCELFLRLNQFPYFCVSNETPFDRLNKTRLLLVPMMAAMGETAQAEIHFWLAKGMDVLLLGPMPEHPETADFAPLSELAGVKPKKPIKRKTGKTKITQMGRLLHLAEFSDTKLLRQLLQLGLGRPLTIEDTRIELRFHRHRSRIFVTAVNPTPELIETQVAREGKFVLKDFWTETKFWGGNGEVKIRISGGAVKFWELIPC